MNTFPLATPKTRRHGATSPHLPISASFLLLLLFTACGPFIDTKHGIISSGFLSSTQGFSGKAKFADGSAVVWSITGTESESVANTAIGFLGTAKIADDGVKSLQSMNAKDVSLGRQAVHNNAILHPVTDTTTVIGPKGGSKVTSKTTVPFP